MDVKYLKQVLLGFLSVVLVLALFCYVVYHLTNGFSVSIGTSPALMGEYYDKTDAEAYVFRHESVIDSEYSGTVNYNVYDGEKSGKGLCVATVYKSGSEQELTARMIEIDSKIELLENSNISDNVSVSDTKSTDDEIQRYIDEMFVSKRDGNYAAAGNRSSELLISLNRRELIVSSRTSYDEQIKELKAQRQVLASQLSGENERIYLSESGYFYYECDGYENIFSPSLLFDMTPSGFDALLSRSPDSTDSVGKNVTSQKWYIALKLDRTDIGIYEPGNVYKIAFNDYSGLYVDMTLERMSTEASEALLVFSSNDMPDGFAYERSQSVSIINEEFEGLRFPLSALRINGGVEGVYVLYGNTVFFRVAEVLGSENGYAYVSTDTESYVVSEADENGEGAVVWSAVSLYDEVIVSGTGLYHGMIVN